MNKQPIFLFKLIITIFLIIFVFKQIDYISFQKIITQINFSYFFFAVLLSNIAFLLLVLRWEILLNCVYSKINFVFLLKYYWIGQFFSLFSFGVFAGDIFRIYKISKTHGLPGRATHIGFLDRALGLLALTIFASAAYVINHFFLKLQLPSYFVRVIFLFWVFLGFGLLMLFYWPKQFLKTKITAIKKINDEFHSSVKIIQANARTVFLAMLVSLGTAFFSFTAILFFAKSLSINLAPIYFYLFPAFVALAVSVPVSINGLGLQDTTYVFLLSSLNVPVVKAIALSLSLHIVRYIIYMFGGLLFLLVKEKQ